jgi:hypothetical protein
MNEVATGVKEDASMSDETNDRLDRLIGLFELANAAGLFAARASIRSDEVVAAILDYAEDWQAVGVLKSAVARSTNTSEKTVQRRIAELVDRRLLEAEGAAASRRVKSTGLV